MFARTTIAKAFRVWVLDVLGKMNQSNQQGILTSSPSLPLTPSTADDRKPLRSLVFAWSKAAGVHIDTCWPQVKAHFQLTRLDDLPTAWIPDALDFVQGKIDNLPKALPEPKQAALESNVTLPDGVFESMVNREVDVITSHIEAVTDASRRLYAIMNSDMVPMNIGRRSYTPERAMFADNMHKTNENAFYALGHLTGSIKQNVQAMSALTKI